MSSISQELQPLELLDPPLVAELPRLQVLAPQDRVDVLQPSPLEPQGHRDPEHLVGVGDACLRDSLHRRVHGGGRRVPAERLRRLDRSPEGRQVARRSELAQGDQSPDRPEGNRRIALAREQDR